MLEVTLDFPSHIVKKREVIGAKIAHQCLVEGDFELKSGIRSNYYFDKYLLLSSPDLLKEISSLFEVYIDHLYGEAMKKNSWKEEAERFAVAGQELGGAILAATFNQRSEILGLSRSLFVRESKKGYGTDAQVEGDMKNIQYCILLEDILTSGESVGNAAKALNEQNIKVMSIMPLIDRRESANITSIFNNIGSIDKNNAKAYPEHDVYSPVFMENELFELKHKYDESVLRKGPSGL